MAQQTAMAAWKASPEGTNLGVDILLGAGRATDEAFLQQFWPALRALEPELASGFSPVPGGLRIVDFDGVWDETALRRLTEAVTKVEQQLGLPASDVAYGRFDVPWSGHDWTQGGTGDGYLTILRARRPDLSRRLVDLAPARDAQAEAVYRRVTGGGLADEGARLALTGQPGDARSALRGSYGGTPLRLAGPRQRRCPRTGP